jgi:nucleotide-binding universal stress UspA family protein
MTATRAPFRILAGVDGSAQARAALATLVEGPWPAAARVRVVVARHTRRPHQRSILLSALDRNADDAAERARRTLADRWPDAEAIVVDKAPSEGILTEAANFRADLIAVGWRGYGTARRLLMGSVSRGVVRGAKCAVLVVRRRPPAPIRNIMVAFDGSPNAGRAVSLVARLAPGRDGRVTLVGVAELMVTSSRGPTVGGIRASISRELRRLNTERSRAAMRALNTAAQELKDAGWRTRTELRTGEPLRELMDSVRRSRAQLLVVGARGTSGVRHLLLGSVAEGALNRSPVPVLLAH